MSFYGCSIIEVSGDCEIRNGSQGDRCGRAVATVTSKLTCYRMKCRQLVLDCPFVLSFVHSLLELMLNICFPDLDHNRCLLVYTP